MELVNQIYKFLQDEEVKVNQSVYKIAVKTIFLLLAPFTPHISEEAWSKLSNKSSIFKQGWPKWDKEFIKQDKIEIAIIINGKVRDHMEIERQDKGPQIEQSALEREKVKEFLSGKKPKKIIYVKDKLVNIVI